MAAFVESCLCAYMLKFRPTAETGDPLWGTWELHVAGKCNLVLFFICCFYGSEYMRRVHRIVYIFQNNKKHMHISVCIDNFYKRFIRDFLIIAGT